MINITRATATGLSCFIPLRGTSCTRARSTTSHSRLAPSLIVISRSPRFSFFPLPLVRLLAPSFLQVFQLSVIAVRVLQPIHKLRDFQVQVSDPVRPRLRFSSPGSNSTDSADTHASLRKLPHCILQSGLQLLHVQSVVAAALVVRLVPASRQFLIHKKSR